MSVNKKRPVLIIDTDRMWCSQLSAAIRHHSRKTISLHEADRAPAMIDQLSPAAIICDGDLSDKTTDTVVTHANGRTEPVPVILAMRILPSGNDNYQKNHSGAFAVIDKKTSIDDIIKIIEKALSSVPQHPETDYLHDLSVFSRMICGLKASHDIESILDLSFDYFKKISNADYTALQLYNSDKRSWRVVRESGGNDNPAIPVAHREHLLALREQVCETHSPVYDNVYPESSETRVQRNGVSYMVVPVMTGTELRGIVLLLRTGEMSPFTAADLQVVEIVAMHTGNAFANLNLHDMVNRRLQELQIISNYSEKLMGLVDTYEVIESLCETTIRHCMIDFIGCLIAKRRTCEFLTWSRYTVDDKTVQDFCTETLEVFERAADITSRRRRIIQHPIELDTISTSPQSLPPLSFKYIIPLVWENLQFGAVVFGAVHEPVHVPNQLELLTSIVGQTRMGLFNTRLYSDMKENYIRTIKALAIAVDAKDTYTHGHSENVMNIAGEIAEELSINKKDIGSIRDAGLLHDIGKIGIPGYILNKPGPLTGEEFNGIMKTHCTLGANIVRDVPFLKDLYKLILYHHEHYDGNGYPDGLKGEQIPIGARILHVADAFESMTSNRPYRQSLGRAEAIRRLVRESGKQFDPAIISAFLRIADRKNWINAPLPDTTTLRTYTDFP